MILVDTSVLIAHLRGDGTAADRQLMQLESDGASLAIPAICAQEVLQGARDEREWKSLRLVLAGQTIAVPADPVATHLAAARLFFDARRRGSTVRSSIDCWIAALAIERDDLLLHADADFERLRTTCPLRTMDARR